jgi:predicted alpha/beta superfamily hydrolase
MKAWTLTLVSQLLAAASLAAQAATAVPLRADMHTYTGGEREVLLTVTHAEVPSKAFHATRDVSIWLPDIPAGAHVRYPVLIFPDAEEKVQFRSALANVQFLIDRQLIPPIMVVGVPYFANRIHELTPRASGATAQTFPTAGGADQTARFIADELLPWVDAHYPTLPTRILAGHSAGGLFGLYMMVTRPEVFRVVIAMSPALFWNDDSLIADYSARMAADSLRARALFLTSGGLENGGLQGNIDGPTTAFAARLTTLLGSSSIHALRFEARRYPRDGHSTTPMLSLVDGLRMAFEPLVVPIDSVYVALSGRHAQDSSEIRATVEELKTRYAAGGAALGMPAPFPEAALDVLGGYSLEAKQPALAVSLLRENLDHYPHSSNAHESLGEGLLAAGDTSEAVKELRTAVTIARGQMQKPLPLLERAHERDVLAAAVAQLHAAHQDDTGVAR